MTDKTKHRRASLIVLGGVALAAAGFFSLEYSMTPRTSRADWPAQFQSNGERLYFTGVSASGQPIRAVGGDRHMLMMGGNACVACHGVDQEGGRLRPPIGQWSRRSRPRL